VNGFKVTFIGDSHSDWEGNARGAFGFLGQHLKELETGKGYVYQHFGASGSIPLWWFDDTAVKGAPYGYTQFSATAPKPAACGKLPCVPKLSVVLAQTPDIFIVEQGTNLMGFSDSYVIAQVKKMATLAASKARTCLWLGAPNAALKAHPQSEQDHTFALLSANSSPCYFYDSRFSPSGVDANGKPIMSKPLPYVGRDGEHFLDAVPPASFVGQSAGTWAEGVALYVEYIKARLANGITTPDPQ